MYIFIERERCVYVVVCDEIYDAVGCIGFQKMGKGFSTLYTSYASTYTWIIPSINHYISGDYPMIIHVFVGLCMA